MKNTYEILFLFNFMYITNEILLDDLISNRNKEDSILLLQDYISMHLKPEYRWMTAISLIDAMESVIHDAMANGNIAFKQGCTRKLTMEKEEFLKLAKEYSDKVYPEFWEVIIRNSIDFFLEQKDINNITPNEWVDKLFDKYNDYLSYD